MIRSRAVAEIYMGIAGRCLSALLEVRALDAFYGDFQALFGVSIDGRAPARWSR